MKGDPHWDNSTLWTIWGHLRSGGIWLKKQSVIAAENNITPVSDLKKGYGLNGKKYDYTTNFTDGGDANKTVAKGRPSHITNYFFLPATGCYIEGKLEQLGARGYYWTSSGSLFTPKQAFYLHFNETEVRMANLNKRNTGQNLWKAE